jgi:hypothetical protein
MMTPDETQVVRIVYERFLESESNEWGDLDSNLEFFDWLIDSELVNESKVKQIKHLKSKNFRCTSDHDQQDCFAPVVLEAVGYILNLWDKTRTLHENNRYILVYYVSMSELNLIFEY